MHPPPDPRVWPGKHFPTPPGHCRWCGRPLLKPDGTLNRRRQFCAGGCRREFDLRADPKLMRRFVYARDMGICQECGCVFDYYTDDGWEADHIRPLFLAWAGEFVDWTFWDPENLQLLCADPCHKAKTRKDLRHFRRIHGRRQNRRP